jgi:purine-binding chemotaxis protein CheW
MSFARDSEPNVDEVLAQRAAALARPVEFDTPVDTVHLVFLSLGDERYGADIRHVLGIEPFSELTPVPGAPTPWIGVINIRGTLVPVLDTRAYMGAQTEEGSVASEAKVVLVSDSRLTVGLLADEVSNVSRVPLAEIRPPLGRGPSSRSHILRGVTPDMVGILDIEKLLSEASRVVEQDPAAQGGE